MLVDTSSDLLYGEIIVVSMSEPLVSKLIKRNCIFFAIKSKLFAFK